MISFFNNYSTNRYQLFFREWMIIAFRFLFSLFLPSARSLSLSLSVLSFSFFVFLDGFSNGIEIENDYILCAPWTSNDRGVILPWNNSKWWCITPINFTKSYIFCCDFKRLPSKWMKVAASTTFAALIKYPLRLSWHLTCISMVFLPYFCLIFASLSLSPSLRVPSQSNTFTDWK